MHVYIYSLRHISKEANILVMESQNSTFFSHDVSLYNLKLEQKSVSWILNDKTSNIHFISSFLLPVTSVITFCCQNFPLSDFPICSLSQRQFIRDTKSCTHKQSKIIKSFATSHRLVSVQPSPENSVPSCIIFTAISQL